MGDCCNALQESCKRGPRRCSPVQPCDLLNECNQRPRVDGRRSSIGQFGRRTDGRRWYQRQAAINRASAAAKFSVVPSVVASCPRYCRDLDHAIFTDWPDLTANWLALARLARLNFLATG
jgi:hypothetical protein